MTFFVNYCVNCEYLNSLCYVYVNYVMHQHSNLIFKFKLIFLIS